MARGTLTLTLTLSLTLILTLTLTLTLTPTLTLGAWLDERLGAALLQVFAPLVSRAMVDPATSALLHLRPAELAAAGAASLGPTAAALSAVRRTRTRSRSRTRT